MKTESTDRGMKWCLSKLELQALLAFASTDPEGAPVHCTICFEEKTRTASATDGKRALMIETRDHDGTQASKITRNLIAVEHVGRLVRMADRDETITLVFGSSRVTCDLVSSGQMSLFEGAKAFDLPLVLDGKFPDVRAIVPKPSEKGSKLEGFSLDANLLPPLKLMQAATGSKGIRIAVPSTPNEWIVVRAEYAEQETSWTAVIAPIREEG
jgi:hypothetical protein